MRYAAALAGGNLRRRGLLTSGRAQHRLAVGAEARKRPRGVELGPSLRHADVLKLRPHDLYRRVRGIALARRQSRFKDFVRRLQPEARELRAAAAGDVLDRAALFGPSMHGVEDDAVPPAARSVAAI